VDCSVDLQCTSARSWGLWRGLLGAVLGAGSRSTSGVPGRGPWQLERSRDGAQRLGGGGGFLRVARGLQQTMSEMNRAGMAGLAGWEMLTRRVGLGGW
jgi:hypothetical protein